MRILLLTPDPPAITGANGGATRQLQLYRRLIELGHEVTVVAPFVQTKGDLVGELEQQGFTVRPYLRPKSRVVEVLGAVARRPALLLAPFRLSIQSFVAAVYWTRLKRISLDTFAESDFDIVCIEQEFAASWIDTIAPGVPRVIVVQQVESAYRRDRSQRLAGPRRWLARIDATRAERYERRWIPAFDLVVCMTQVELDRLRKIVGDLPPATVLPNGADVRALAAVGPDPGQDRVLFTGTLAFEPNAVAAKWLAREVWPRVIEERPQARLEIVGRSPGDDVLALGAANNVTVHADVPDIRMHFERASICTLPMLEGGGTRLKLAEAFAARRAVVSTTNGVEGIDVEAGKEALVSDDPREFAAAIVYLLRDLQARQAVADRGHKFAVENFDWSELGERWAQTLRELHASKSST